MDTNITIVEYDHSYAAAVADMWTRSGDSWGGFNIVTSAESVRQEEETSVYLNLYLAVAGDEVVGYCKLAQWMQDEGALYIAGLNVRPDMHGRKIGKALVLKTVERTIELGWGRLDLHTWAGNTKAVPLYKKTGFFWEERDSEVYCVNYIPAVLANPLVRDFFDHADWYTDSLRPIEVAPDGREENKFIYFTYTWEKEGKRLEMEFERRGRGLRRISRDGFDIELTVENRDLIFGSEYVAIFRFSNRSGHPLAVGVRGQDDRNIRFHYAATHTVDDGLEIRAPFHVGPIANEQSEWKTHPRVCAEITIGDRSALFAVGIVPKFPAAVQFRSPSLPILDNANAAGYLDVENNYTESADFTFRLENSDDIEFKEPVVRCLLEAGERKSIKVPVSVKRPTVYASLVKATAERKSGAAIDFKREIGGLFARSDGVYHGEMVEEGSKRAAVIGVGPVKARLVIEQDSRINELYVTRHGYTAGIRFFPFKIGKPYDDEFFRIPPEHIEFEECENGRQMRASYATGRFPGLNVTMYVQIDFAGCVSRWFAVKNNGDTPLANEIFVQEDFRTDPGDILLPFDGRMLEARTETPGDFWYWDGERLNENWVYSRRHGETVGLFWEKNASVATGEWFLSAEHRIGTIHPGQAKLSPVVTAAIGVFQSWGECRDFALGRVSDRTPEEESLEISVNSHNPFVKPVFAVKLIEHKQKVFDGSIGIKIDDEAGESNKKIFDRQEALRQTEFTCDIDGSKQIGVVNIDIDLIPIGYRRKRAVFPISGGAVTAETVRQDGFETICVSNGCISIRSAPGYAPGIISCVYNGNEWLDSGFPKYEPKDWWNPWIGGILFSPDEMDARPLLREKADIKVVEKKDTKGNCWKGVKCTVRFAGHDGFRGLVLEQYYMMLPDIPLLFSQVVIRQSTGKFFEKWKIHGGFCFCGSSSTSDIRFEYLNRLRQRAGLSSGYEEIVVNPESCVMVSDNNLDEKAILFLDRRRARITAETQKHSAILNTYDEITCEDGSIAAAPAKFLLFSDRWIEEEWLADLRYIDLCYPDD